MPNKTMSRTLTALVASGALLIPTACANGPASGGPDEGTGLPAGATQDEYIEAMEDLDTITVNMQSLSPTTSVSSRYMTEYAKALEEWSGGKIEAEVAYSSSIASLPEAAEALADGRLDFARHAPLYEPEEYPATNALVDLSFLGGNSPVVGRLERLGAYSETALSTQSITEEFEGHGLQPAFPVSIVTPSTVLACKGEAATTLEDMQGLRARASGPVHVKQLEGLGITPSDLNITEIYTGLQRGVIDCGEMSLSTLAIVGALDVANHVSYGDEVGFADVPGAFSFGRSFWEQTPLVARQLMWDRLDVFIEGNIQSGIQAEIDALKTINENGGQVDTWEPEVQDRLKTVNDDLLDQAGAENSELVATLEENLSKWRELTTGELGYADTATYADLSSWPAAGEIDLEPYVNRFVEDVLAPARPE